MDVLSRGHPDRGTAAKFTEIMLERQQPADDATPFLQGDSQVCSLVLRVDTDHLAENFDSQGRLALADTIDSALEQ